MHERESISFSITQDQGGGLPNWSATPTFRRHWFSTQIGLSKLCYSYVKL